MTLLRRRITVLGIPVLAFGLALLAQPAVVRAQDRPGDDTTHLEAIQVTGSRIKRAEVEGQTGGGG